MAVQFEKPIALGADHGGYELKEAIKQHLEERGIAYCDFGTNSTASCDYPDYAAATCGGMERKLRRPAGAGKPDLY